MRGRIIRKLVTPIASSSYAMPEPWTRAKIFRTAARPKSSPSPSLLPRHKKTSRSARPRLRRPFYTLDLPYLWGRLFRDKVESGSRNDRLDLRQRLVPPLARLAAGQEKDVNRLRQNSKESGVAWKLKTSAAAHHCSD